jgi:hypothetical protein
VATKPCRLSGFTFQNGHPFREYRAGSVRPCPVCGERVALHETKLGYRIAWHKPRTRAKIRALRRIERRAINARA